MGDEREIDPEVRADLELRESSQRDMSRTRGRGVYDWRRPEFVATWPCRKDNCRAPVQVTQEAVDAFAVANARMAQLNEQPVRTDAVVLCDACRKRREELIADRNRKRVDEMRALILEYKGEPPPNPTRERELQDRIIKLNHPDPQGLFDAVKKRRETESGPRKKAPL